MAKEDLIIFVFIAIAAVGIMVITDFWNTYQRKKKTRTKIQERMEKREKLGEEKEEQGEEPKPRKAKTPYKTMSWSCAVYGCPNLRLMPSEYCGDHGGKDERDENEV